MKTRYIFTALLLQILISSCKKDWLDAKPSISLTVPSTIKDYQALLDNSDNIFNVNYPLLGEIGADDYYISLDSWQALFTATEKNAYIWASDIYEGEAGNDWNNCYNIVYNANVVLDGISAITPGTNDQDSWNNVAGSALFFRSFAFYNLLQLFARPYDSSTAAADPGIPIRLSSDVNIPSSRENIKDCYAQIINDVEKAAALLPQASLHKSRPSKPAAYALLARTFLTIGMYDSALVYSNACLSIYNALLDYNTLDTTADYPVPIFNSEDLFDAWGISYYIFFPSNLLVDSTLYASYNSSDLRKTIFFKRNLNVATFRGSYTGSFIFYTGIATDEVYLIRSEANARLGNTAAALDDLNTLLAKRYRTGSFNPVTATDNTDALKIILLERRKELLFRALRWTDLRRLNTDSRFAKTLTRNLNAQIYTLPPGDARYVLPIPKQEIQVSGIQQNAR